MAFNDKYHINPVNGNVSKCSAVIGQCPFGSLNHHFRDEKLAKMAFEKKAASFYNWTARSNVPQEQGWITEHVFDPDNEGTYFEMLLWMEKVPEGTHLVMENGWVFKKIVGKFWELIEGTPPRIGFKKNTPVSFYSFLDPLENFGGRLEFNKDIPPMKINWRL